MPARRFSDPEAADTTVRFSDPGTYVLRAIASDNGYETASELTVLVTDSAPGGGNLAPRVSLTDSAPAATASPFDLSATIPAVLDDGLPSPPATVATVWTQVAGPGPVDFAEPAVPAGTADFPFPGTYTLRLTAHDGAVKTFDEVSIAYSGPGNGVPVTTGIADASVPVNAGELVVDLFPAFEDGEDADPDLVYSLEANTNPALFAGAAIGGDPERLNLQFAADTPGSARLTVRATDTDGHFVDATFTVTVSNSAPSIAPIADQSIAEGQTLNLGVSASDPDNQGLTYSLVAGSPSGMVIDPASGALTWTPGEGDGPGTHPVVVKAVDHSSQALGSTRYFRVTVAEVNQPPVIAPISNFPAFAQPDFTLAVSANDPDLPANSLRYFLDSKPPEPRSTRRAGPSCGRPPPRAATPSPCASTTSDYPNLSDTEAFSVEVSNAAPTLANQSFAVAENSPPGTEVGTIAASDGDGDGITFAIAGGNPGGAFAIDPVTGRITVAASAPLDFEANAAHVLTVRASDDAVPSLARLATVTVNLTNLNEAPAVPTQTLEVAEGEVLGAPVGTVERPPTPKAIRWPSRLSPGNDAGVFALDPQSGVLRIAARATLTQPIETDRPRRPTPASPRSRHRYVTVVLTRRLVASPAAARVLVPPDNTLSGDWKDVGFDDSAWQPRPDRSRLRARHRLRHAHRHRRRNRDVQRQSQRLDPDPLRRRRPLGHSHAHPAHAIRRRLRRPPQRPGNRAPQRARRNASMERLRHRESRRRPRDRVRGIDVSAFADPSRREPTCSPSTGSTKPRQFRHADRPGTRRGRRRHHRAANPPGTHDRQRRLDHQHGCRKA